MSDSQPPIPLYLHTIDSLCKELISGRQIAVQDNANFLLTTEQARAALAWYYNNKSKWPGRVMKDDVEALVDAISELPPTYDAPKSSGESVKRIVHITSITAHRFAGIHHYGSTTKTPPDFKHHFKERLTVIEGSNGAGKSSLLNAIVWCLTGAIYRPQREPEPVSELLEITTSDPPLSADMCAITPLPSKDVMESLNGTALPLDTWVEITLSDESDNEIGRIKRSVTRHGRNNRLETTASGLDTLGLPPIAIEVGTRMPGLLPYIRPGNPSDLGHAVSQITGLSPLRDLQKHAQRTQREKLRRELPNDLSDSLRTLDAEFRETWTTLIQEISNQQIDLGIGPAIDPDNDKAADEIKSLLQKAAALRVSMLGDAQSLLGETFDATNAKNQLDLSQNIGPALGLVETIQIQRLPSAIRMEALRATPESELTVAQRICLDLFEEANQLASLSANPQAAARVRLYGRVGRWLKEQGHSTSDCPICATSLENKHDPATKKLVSEHLHDFISGDREFLEHTIEYWVRDAVKRIKSTLTGALLAELERDLPPSPVDLIRGIFDKELFHGVPFRTCLKALHPATVSAFDKAATNLPPYTALDIPSWPSEIAQLDDKLQIVVSRLYSAISFAKWSNVANDACLQLLAIVIGTDETDDTATLRHRLDILDRV